MIQIQQAITAFLASLAQTGKAITTQRNYHADLRLVSRELLRQTPGLQMPALTSEHLQAALQATRVGQRMDGSPRSLDARMRIYTTVKLFGHWAHQTGLCEADPTQGMAPPTTVPLPVTPILSEEHISALRRVVWHDRYPAHLQLRQAILLECLLTTGLHIEELVAVNCTDIDLTQRLLRIAPLQPQPRTIHLTTRLCEYLTAYLAYRNPLMISASPALFLSARKTRLSAITAWNHLALWGTWAGLPFRLNTRIFHATFATRLFILTQDVRVLIAATGRRRSLAALLAIRPTDITLREVVDAL